MMPKEYPLISRTQKRDKNTCAKCKCGEIGRYKVTIETCIFRGEDEVAWSCEDHKKDAEFLYFDESAFLERNPIGQTQENEL